MILTIKRSEWVRGNTTYAKFGTSALLNEKGKMCCLGFDAIACGVAPEVIKHRSDPQDVFHHDDASHYDYVYHYDDVYHYNVDLEGLETSSLKDYYKNRVTPQKVEGSRNKVEVTNTLDVREAIRINDAAYMPDSEREALLIPILKRIGSYAEVVFVD